MARYNKKLLAAIADRLNKNSSLGNVKITLHPDGYWLFEQEGARELTRQQCNGESAEQKTVWGWLCEQHPQMVRLTWHTPNEIAANAFYGAQQKQMGKQSGVSDLVTLYGAGGAFELKRVNPALYRMSKEQKQFLQAVAASGKFACCAWGAVAMQRAIMFYLQDEWR